MDGLGVRDFSQRPIWSGNDLWNLFKNWFTILLSSCYRPEWVILVWDMVAKKLYKHPWEETLSQPMHVNKVLVHEEAVVFHYDDVNGDNVVFALDIGRRGSVKVLWNEKVGFSLKYVWKWINVKVCSKVVRFEID